MPPTSFAGWRPELIEVSRLLGQAPTWRRWGGAAAHRRPTERPSLTGPDSTVLVDAGEGILSSWYPGCERAGLAAAPNGRTPDLIALTHLDFDHVGGLLAGEWPGEAFEPVFPSAPVFLLEAGARRARADDPHRAWNSATRAVAVFEQAGLLRELDDGEEFAHGLRLRAAPGHRSGHAVLEAGDGFLHLADTIHDALHVEHPDWDGCPRPRARARPSHTARPAPSEEAAQRGALCVSSHVRGAGHVVRAGDGFRRSPLDGA